MPTWEWYSLVACISALVGIAIHIRYRLFTTKAALFLLVALICTAFGYGASLLVSLVSTLPQIVTLIIDYAWIVATSFTLTALANILRNDKPGFARYPFLFTLLPLLIIPVFALISDTILIKNWVLGLFQAGALLISVLLFGLMAMREKTFRSILLTWPFFAASWTLKWILPDLSSTYWLVPILLSAGIILASKAFQIIQSDPKIVPSN